MDGEKITCNHLTLTRDTRLECPYTTPMTDNRKAGIALIAGSIGGVVTMAILPAGVGRLNPDSLQRLIWVSGIAHTLALVSVLLLFLGTCGLTQRLAAPDRIAFSALVTFGFSAVAIMIAGAVSGWIVPGILKLSVRDVAANASQWEIATASIFQINQAMSKIYSVGTSLAITLWSVSVLRQGHWSRGIAVFGCVTAPLIALLIFAGHLRLNVHGMAIVMLSQVVWFTGIGIGLMRDDRAR